MNGEGVKLTTVLVVASTSRDWIVDGYVHRDVHCDFTGCVTNLVSR